MSDPDLPISEVPDEVWSRVLEHAFDPMALSDDALVPQDSAEDTLAEDIGTDDVVAAAEDSNPWDLADDPTAGNETFDPFGSGVDDSAGGTDLDDSGSVDL